MENHVKISFKYLLTLPTDTIKLEERLRLLEQNICVKKETVSVMVFGSYEPEKCLNKLEKLCSGLRKEGWEKARLVREIPNYDGDAYQKSVRALYDSQVNLFVFMKDCPQGGVSIEARHVLNDKKLWEKSCFMVGSNGSKTYISGLLEESKEYNRVYRREFKHNDDTSLLRQANSAILSVSKSSRYFG